MANTKLCSIEKTQLLSLKTNFEWLGGKIFHFRDLGVCVGIRRTGKEMAEFSVSIRSPKEKKYKKKVAEYFMLRRCPMPCQVEAKDTVYTDDYATLENIADSIAFSVSKG